VAQATRFVRQSEFLPWFFWFLKVLLSGKEIYVYRHFLKRQTKVKGNADPVHVMKEGEGMEV